MCREEGEKGIICRRLQCRLFLFLSSTFFNKPERIKNPPTQRVESSFLQGQQSFCLNEGSQVTALKLEIGVGEGGRLTPVGRVPGLAGWRRKPPRPHSTPPPPAVHSYTAPFCCRRSGVKQPLVLQLFSTPPPLLPLPWLSLLRAFQRCASGSMKSEREESR